MKNEEIVTLYQKTGNKELLEQLYTRNLPLIDDVARLYEGYCEKDDLRQEGFLGLDKASKTWEAEKGASFATYARYWIRAFISRYVMENCNVVRLPAQIKEVIIRAKKAQNEHYMRYGKQPSIEELAKTLELSGKKAQETLDNMRFLTVASLNEPLTGIDEGTIEDTIADD